jgi:hypothetical protein
MDILQTCFHDIVTRALLLRPLIKLCLMQQNYDLPEKFYVTCLHHSVPHYVESWKEIKIILISYIYMYVVD